MTIKQREILLRLNEQVKKLTENPPTTFSPNTGNTPKETQYNPASQPKPLPFNTNLNR